MQRIGMAGVIVVVFVAIMGLGAAMIAWAPDQLLKFVYIVPVIFLFLAIAAFLLLLLHYAVVLQRHIPGLAVTALGLPEGSIRAFIAIGLLALVAVFGTFLYFESKAGTYPEVGIIANTSLEDAKKAIDTARFMLVPRGNNTFSVVSTTLDTSRSDLAKQLLTMITTLLTTIVGFYFGSRSSDASPSGAQPRGGGGGAPTPESLRTDIAAARATAGELSKRIDDLGPEVTKLATPEPQDTVNKALTELRDKIAQADTDFAAAEAAAAVPDATAADIEAASQKVAAAANVLAGVKAKLDAAAGDLGSLKPDTP